MILQTKYAFCAIFTSDGFDYPQPDNEISIRFPDIPGAISCGDNFTDGVNMAQDCLAIMLIDSLENNLPIPEPTSPDAIKLAVNETLHLIQIDLRDYYPEEITKLEMNDGEPVNA